MGLEELFGRIEKRFGKEAVVGNDIKVDTVSSGSMALDEILGGGFALGRIHEIYGGFSSGKSSAALHLSASVQKTFGKAVGYVDTEQALDLEYAKALGVDLSRDKWIMSQPDSAEQALEIVREMLEVPEIGLVVLDSVAGLVPEAVLQGEAGDAKIALVARLMSQQLSILKNVCKKNGNILLCINQTRQKIGGMGFGPTTTTPGGEALKFYATQRAEFARIGTEKTDGVATANKTQIKVVKNKIAPPFRVCQVMLEYGVGFDTVQELIDMSIREGICSKKGAWFYYGETRLGQGMDNAKKALSDKDLFNEIKNKLIETLCIPKD